MTYCAISTVTLCYCRYKEKYLADVTRLADGLLGFGVPCKDVVYSGGSGQQNNLNLPKACNNNNNNKNNNNNLYL